MPKKKLASTPLLSAKITVQWSYFHHKNFNRIMVGLVVRVTSRGDCTGRELWLGWDLPQS